MTNVPVTRAAFRRLLPLLALCACAAVWAQGESGSSGEGSGLSRSIVRVEEDWALLVGEPHPATASPQVSTQMAPRPDSDRFCNLHLNSTDLPVFSQGGLQLQVWKGGEGIAYKTILTSPVMQTPGELVTWTQYLRKDGSRLIFGVSTAASKTWGNFSGMEVEVPGGDANLDDYSSEYSLLRSGVTYGANRVRSMVLLRTKKIYDTGEIETDATPQVIFSSVLDPELGEP
jgi:hypothetical protein